VKEQIRVMLAQLASMVQELELKRSRNETIPLPTLHLAADTLGRVQRELGSLALADWGMHDRGSNHHTNQEGSKS
jgi:hypothetical protein